MSVADLNNAKQVFVGFRPKLLPTERVPYDHLLIPLCTGLIFFAHEEVPD
jgi:hypothetical protein